MKYLSLVSFFFAGIASAQIHVPGDYPDPQTAVNNASPGDVIVVHGGTWTSAGVTPALTIDKPITLIGDPAPLFEPPFGTAFGQQPPAVLLSGPGSGTVVLARVSTGGLTNGNMWSMQSGGLVGGGFAEVHVYDSNIAAPTWVGLTGVAEGTSGIDVTAPYLLLSNSSVHASNGGDDGCYGFAIDGDAGVRFSGTVVVLDSTVVGGTYLFPCFFSPGCAPITSGNGGPGIAAPRVDEAGSSISGGPGAVWSDVNGVPCGSAAAGPAVVATTHVVLANDLTSSAPVGLGDTLTLSWNTPGPSIQIYYSRRPSAPYTVLPGFTDAYLTGSIHLLGSFAAGGGVQSTNILVPNLAILVGEEFTFQGVDSPSTVTRPVSIVLGP